MKVIIGTMNNLPEYCWNCPCCSSVGRCRADKERRKTSEYRPFWCPLQEEQEEQVAISEEQARQHSIKVSCDMCGKIVEHYSLIAINDNLHACKKCEQWLRDHCTKSEKEQLHMDEEEKICVAKCNRCGKIVERSSLTTVAKIRHGGTSVVNYPHDGEFIICKDCEQWLLKQLTSNKEGGTKK